MNFDRTSSPRCLKSSVDRFLPALAISCALLVMAGCETVVNNNLQVNTAMGKVVTGGSVFTPLGSQPVAGQWVADIPTTSPLNTVDIAPFGSTYSFEGVTLPYTNASVEAGELTDEWPTEYYVSNARMPAYWDFAWQHPSYCIDTSAPPYPLLANPATYTDLVELPTEKVFFTPANPQRNFYCYINSPANPDFAPAEVSPQIALDNALPPTIQVHAFSPISAAANITNLRLFSMSLTNPANVTAESVASDGSSAVFPYPTAVNGAALPAGPYIATITTDPVGEPQTTNGMEAIYIAHNDTSYTSAFGVDVAVPEETITTVTFSEQLIGNKIQACLPTTTTTTTGGSSLPLVTLPQLGELAVGNSSNTITVGTHPTVVIAYNGQTVSSTTTTSGCATGAKKTTYTGAQSALVVNTGSNSVSLVNVGQYKYPSGTVSVGTQPVAAVINPAGTLAYIANYASGTISEISLSGVAVTRTLSVGTHPTSLAFDSAGNLWVGGQGYLQSVDITTWAIGTTYAVDGTLNGISYDTASGEIVGALLQNGTASSPSKGSTEAEAIAFSKSGGVSYSTTGIVSLTSGSTTTSTIASDTETYSLSSLATGLAYPAQTAFNPPIYTSSNGDIIASANGTSFTVTALSTGSVLISGTTPYPIRGVKLTSTMLYLTMPDSNSLVSLPMLLP
jgi:YVTN family beta-propeller protein